MGQQAWLAPVATVAIFALLPHLFPLPRYATMEFTNINCGVYMGRLMPRARIYNIKHAGIGEGKKGE